MGVAKVVKEAYPDFTAFDPESKYFDPKSSADKPRWFMVDIQFQKKLKRTITLAELKQNPFLEGMQLLRKGNRLSVMPVAKTEFDCILAML